MTPLVDYWLKANLFLLLFYGCYALLLRRHTFLMLNRTYLMGSLALAMVLPLVHIPGLSFPWPWEGDVPVYASISADTLTVVGTATETEAPLLPDWPVLAIWTFALVAAGLLVHTGWRTYALLRLIRQWPAQSLSDHTLVLPDNAQAPTFSFFRYLVLNPDDAQTEAVRQHELVHIRQKHSLDILLLEVIHALCWLNPVLFGYRQAIRQVHEYLADRDAAPQTPTHRDAYARFLVSYAFHLPAGMPDHNSLAHSFGPDRPDSPTLKQRIQMLYQQHTRRRALWKYALVLPLATVLLAMTNEPEQDTVVVKKPDVPLLNAPASLTMIEQQPEFPGGTKAFIGFLDANLRYPEEARQKKIQGKVFVSFVVNPDGAIDRIRVLKGIGAGCDEEVVRVISIMPKWIPGLQSGRPVAVTYMLPIAFGLSDKAGLNQSPSSEIRVGYSPMDSVVKNSPPIYQNGKTVVIDKSRFKSDTSPPTTGSTGGPSIKVRGKSNLSMDGDPLFFLNGEEITKEEMEALDTKTIQSINVLKDASATSVYGEKGRNGVVQITTKKSGEPERKKDR